MPYENTGGRTVPPTIIFLHIAKTAGMTLRMILNRQFASSQIMILRSPVRTPVRLRREETLAHYATLPEWERRRARLIEGHTIFGLHELVPGPSTYITLIRNPVALTVSHYNFVSRRPRHWLHGELTASDMSLDAYVRSGIALETDNSQTRALSGDTTTPFGECSERMLEMAKANVERHFTVVGLTERFDETLLLLKRAFGWSRLHYVPLNVGSSRKPRAAVGEHHRKLIEEQNRFDVELYQWASTRFEAEIANDPSFEVQLRRFRQANSMYKPLGHLRQTLPRRIVVGLRRSRSVDGGSVDKAS